MKKCVSDGVASKVPVKKSEPLILALRDLVQWTRSERISMMVIGGFAVSLLGRQRATKDIDAVAVIPNEDWRSFVASGKKFHFQPRIKDWYSLAQQTMVILLEHVTTGTPIDLSVGGTEFEQQAIAHAQPTMLKRLKVPLVRVSDLIVFKALARRPVDWADIDNLLNAHSSVDNEHIQGWLSQFADILEDSTILTDYCQFVEKHRRR